MILCSDSAVLVAFVSVVDDGFIKWDEDESFEVEYILDHVHENVSTAKSVMLLIKRYLICVHVMLI